MVRRVCGRLYAHDVGTAGQRTRFEDETVTPRLHLRIGYHAHVPAQDVKHVRANSSGHGKVQPETTAGTATAPTA
jgi:hypothetical protein